MGADTFFEFESGPSPAEAFRKVVEQAQYENGHGGYTGTIAEKSSFRLIRDTPPQIEGKSPKSCAMKLAEMLIDDGDERVDDKWGPAGCIEIEPAAPDKPGRYLFFGWAAS